MNNRRRLTLTALAAALLIAACGSPSAPATQTAATQPAATQPAAVAASISPATPAVTPEAITLLTEAARPQACMDALAQGTLVPDPRSGLALATTGGERTPVMWPFGYSARLVDGQIELLDDSGEFVAREGDTVQAGGGFGAGGMFYACAGLQRVNQ